ncbi:MAG: putative sulfate exporter family transporter [Rikenellaceae bacterium]
MEKGIYLLLALSSLFLSPAISLFAGIAFALILGSVFKKQSLKVSKYLLQVSVVGLGFGMNLMDAIESSSDGIVFTIFSVVLVMVLGVYLSKVFSVERKLGYLISSGTAICGGSAIAAISPVVKANSNETSMSLAVVFTLNAIALFIFPAIGEFLSLTQQQFGTWAAIAIHDTSSVVGAGQIYGEEALKVATTVKLTRALWIIPLSLVSTFVFKNEEGGKGKITIPWFILLFVVAMIINTYIPINTTILNFIKLSSHKMLSLTLFLIGGTLSIEAIRNAGIRPIIFGLSLWIVIAVLSLVVIKVGM